MANTTPLTASNRERLEGLRGRFGGEQCVVLCTGPSVAEVDLSLLERHPYVMGVNGSFALRNRFHSYFVDSPAFVARNAARIAQVESDRIFVRQHTAGICLDAGVPSERLFSYTVPKHKIGVHISSDLTAGLPFGPTVLLTIVLPAVVWCGFQEVLLLGADYPTRGYSRIPTDADKVSYWDKPVAKHEREMNVARLRALMWADYLRSQHPEVRVINCSRASELQAFDRAPLESVLR